MNRALRIVICCVSLFYVNGALGTEVDMESRSHLPALNALTNQTSISGLSSGAFMTAQFHIAYSENLVGAGIVAGGPWSCAFTNPLLAPLVNATTSCMNPCQGNAPCAGFPDGNYLAQLAREHEADGDIDTLSNILDDKLYIFSGQADETVKKGVVDSLVSFYTALGMNTQQMYYNASVDAGHAFVTANPSDSECDLTQSPYLNDCDIYQAQRILEQIYGELEPPASELSGELLVFDQTEFFDSSLASMDKVAFAYVPSSCSSEQCKVHVAVHGCAQGVEEIGTEFVTDAGYNEVADSNGIIVLYPQAIKSSVVPYNPQGCWDFWGYTDNSLPPFNFYKKTSIQMTAIKSMIDRITSSSE